MNLTVRRLFEVGAIKIEESASIEIPNSADHTNLAVNVLVMRIALDQNISVKSGES